MTLQEFSNKLNIAGEVVEVRRPNWINTSNKIIIINVINGYIDFKNSIYCSLDDLGKTDFECIPYSHKIIDPNTGNITFLDDIEETPARKYMDFSSALLKVKNGERIFRHGWNGKGLYVAYQKGYPDGIPCNEQTAKTWGLKEGDLFKCNPYLQIKCADGTFSMWVPSIGDILAEDWECI